MLKTLFKKLEKILWSTPQENISRATAFVIRNVKLVYFVWKKLIQDKCLQQAAALSFQTIFSLIPLAVISVYFIKSFVLPDEIYTSIENFLFSQFNIDHIRLYDDAGGEIILKNQIVAIVNAIYAKIGSHSINFFGIIILALIGLALLITMENAINAIWGARKKRSIFKKLFNYCGAVTIVVILLALSFFLSSKFGSMMGERWSIDFLKKIYLFAFPFALSVAFYFFIYKLIPNTNVRWRCAFEGAVVAGILWTVAKSGFRIYVRKVLVYSLFYGALGLLPLFLLWVYIGWVILLFGAEISFTRQHLKALDLKKIREVEGNYIRADLLALGALYCLAKRFYQKNEPPLRLSQLSETFNITENDMSRLLDVLADAGILARTMIREEEGDAYVLALAPERIKICEVVKLVSEKLHSRLDKRIGENLADFAPVFNDFVKAEQDGFGSMNLRNLMAKAQSPTEAPAIKNAPLK